MGEAGANIKITGEAPYVQNWLAEATFQPRTSRTEPLPGGYTGGKHTHPRLNGRVYETAPQDQSERFGRQTEICFDQADGE